MPDYSALDSSQALTYIFYPRNAASVCPKYGFDHFVPVAPDIAVHCRYYKENDAWPWILYFHGNGEVVSDYDEISIFFLKSGINLVVADYRGYGKSGGDPTLTAIAKDAYLVFDAVKAELAARGYGQDLWVMGRSLGSIPALELAHSHKTDIKGLIIESGFPSVTRLLQHLDVPVTGIDLDAIEGECLTMIGQITTPVLIIHGEYDTLVPLEEAETLRDTIGSKDKEFVVIPGATHNDIMFLGLKQYMEAIRAFMERTR